MLNSTLVKLFIKDNFSQTNTRMKFAFCDHITDHMRRTRIRIAEAHNIVKHCMIHC